jgi:peptide/nickel transport system substrate-binding protein
VQPQDVLRLKRDKPSMQMVSVVPAANSPGFITGYGWNDLNGKKAPWLDVRVRQAMSMALDRESYIIAFYNVDQFEDAGLPVETYYNTSMGPIPGVTLDPRDKDFGENAKYLSYDVAEAKKLLSAAGFGDGFEYDAHFVGSNNFGAAYPKQTETMNSFYREAGLKPNAVPIDYNLRYLPDFVTQQGKHEGTVYRIGAVTSPDAVDYYVWRFYSKSGATSGAVFTGGTGEMAGDPEVDSFIDKAKAETDAKKRVAILGDLQRHLAKMCYCVPNPGAATRFDVAWPAVKNFYAFQNDSRAINQGYYTWWIDDTQPPIKS